jgi:hypothetical protein
MHIIDWTMNDSRESTTLATLHWHVTRGSSELHLEYIRRALSSYRPPCLSINAVHWPNLLYLEISYDNSVLCAITTERTVSRAHFTIGYPTLSRITRDLGCQYLLSSLELKFKTTLPTYTVSRILDRFAPVAVIQRSEP